MEQQLQTTRNEAQQSYDLLWAGVTAYISSVAHRPLWRTNGKKLSFKPFMDPVNLRDDFRQMINCRTCADFIRDYGSVSFLNDDLELVPLLWSAPVPTEWQLVWDAMLAQCKNRTRIRGPLATSDLREILQPVGRWQTVLPQEGKEDQPKVLLGRHEFGGFNHMHFPLYEPSMWGQEFHVSYLNELVDNLMTRAWSQFYTAERLDRDLRKTLRIINGQPQADKFQGELRMYRGFINSIATRMTAFPKADRKAVIWSVLAENGAYARQAQQFPGTLAGKLLEMVRQDKSEALVLQFYGRNTDSLHYQRTEKETTTEGETERFRAFLEQEGFTMEALVARYPTLQDFTEHGVMNRLVMWRPTCLPQVDNPVAPVDVFAAMQGKKPQPVDVLRTAPKAPAAITLSAKAFVEGVLPQAQALRMANRNTYLVFQLVHGQTDTKPILRWDLGEERMPVAPCTWTQAFPLSHVGVPATEDYVYATSVNRVCWCHTGEDVHRMGDGWMVNFNAGPNESNEAFTKTMTGGLFPQTLRNEFHPHRRAAEIFAHHRPVTWEGDVQWSLCVGPNGLNVPFEVYNGEFWTEYRFGSWE